MFRASLQKKRTKVFLLSAVLALLFLAGACAHYPVNPPLSNSPGLSGYRMANINPARNSEGLLFVLTCSGGATSSSAISYGVLKELAGTEVYIEGKKRRLLDEVDVISAVSGGTFASAYYGLYGDRIFAEFEDNFLKKQVQTGLMNYLIHPRTLTSFFSSTFSRSDAAAEYFDKNVFHGATFGDIKASGGPFVLINSTEMSLGSSFTFSQDQFDLIGSDVSCVSVARAVTAASAVPGFFTPIALKNYGADAGKMPYLQLIDGGISDNLGIRPVLDRVFVTGEYPPDMLKAARKVVFIVVNAETKSKSRRTLDESAPSISWTLRCATGALLSRYNLETMERLKSTLKKWDDGSRAGEAAGAGYYIIEVNLDLVKYEPERDYLNALPVSFNLPPGAVERLIDASRKVLKESPEFQRLLKDLGEVK